MEPTSTSTPAPPHPGTKEDGGEGARHGLRAQLLRQATAFAGKSVNALASAGLTILLAHTGGPRLVGAYALAIQTAQLLAVFAVMGMDQVLLRRVARDARTGVYGMMRRIVAQGLSGAAARATAIAAAYLAILFLFVNDAGWPAMAMAAAFLIVQAVYVVALYALRALGRTGLAQLYEGAYAIPLAGLTAAAMLADVRIAAWMVVTGAVLCLAINLVLVIVAVVRTMHTQAGAVRASSASVALAGQEPLALRTGLPFLGIAAMIAITQWLPVAALGLFVSEAEAGAFRAAFQLIMIVTMFAAVSTAVVSPQMAGDFALGRADLVRHRFRIAQGAILAVSAPPLLLMIMAPATVLTTLFGAGFAGAGPVLLVLAAGQLVCAAAGPAGAITAMANRERDSLAITAASLSLLVIAGWLLVPRMGAVGAAFAYVLSTVVRAAATYRIAGRLMSGASGTTAP